MNQNIEYLIIGGGVSGLYILDNLKEKYNIKDILLLERYPYLGGRIRSLYDKRNKPILEKGCWRFNESHLKLKNLLKKLKIEYEKNSSSDLNSKKINYDICNKKSIKLQKKFKKQRGFSYKDTLTTKKNICYAQKIETFSKLPLVMDSTSKPYDVNMEYTGSYYYIKEGFTKIVEKLNNLHYNNINLNCYVNDVKYCKKDKLYSVFYQIRDGDNYTYTEIKTKNLFLCLPPRFTENWEIVKNNLLPLIYSVNTLPLHHIYGYCKDINKFYNNKFYINTNSELSQIISGDFSNNWFQVSYTSGERALYWNRIKLNNPNLFKKKINTALKNLKINLEVSKVMSFYWERAIHYWEPNINFNLNESVKKSVYPHPVNLPNLYWAGEAFSTNQGWIEGALETSELLLDRFTKNMSKIKLFKQIKIKKTDEYMIIDNRYIDVKKWKKIHPGSYAAIQNHLFEDISLLFRHINHPKYSWNIINSLQKHWFLNGKIIEYNYK